MTSKEFLEEYRKAGGRIIRITAELEELRTQAELPGYGLSATPVKKSARSRIDDTVPTLIDETAELEDELHEARRIRRQVKKAIAAVRDDRYREVLAYIYICGFTLEQRGFRAYQSTKKYIIKAPLNVPLRVWYSIN